MAGEVHVRVGADLGGAITAINDLKQALSAAADPVARFKATFADAGAAMQQTSAAAMAAFRADLQRMVAEHALSLQQALALDMDYTAQHGAEQQAQYEAVLAGDAESVAEKAAAYAELAELSSRYSLRLAQDQRRIADAAQHEAERIARPYRQAFDEIGAGWRSAVTGLVEGTLTVRGAALRVAQSVERGVIGMIQTTLSQAAAGPLASLLGLAAPAAGEGVGDVLGRAVGGFLFGTPQQLGETAAVGGLFDWLGGLFAFAAGGIVPSAARGWALPNFFGARPALLHAREMVLPAPISDGLQRLVAEGSGGDMHLHFHGPSDGPAVERWFTGLMARHPDVVRGMLRSNALTPRTL